MRQYLLRCIGAATRSIYERTNLNIKTIAPHGNGSLLLDRLNVRFPNGMQHEIRGQPTICQLLKSKVPPEHERDPNPADLGIIPHGTTTIFRDCTVDGNMPVSLYDATLAFIECDISGFGHVTWIEVVVKRDLLGATRSALLSSFGGPLIVSASAAERPSKREEEDNTARAIAKAINERQKTRYRAYRLPENSRRGESWEDGVLRSPVPSEPQIALQIRHFSPALAKLLRGPKRSVINHDIVAFRAILQSAIDAKRDVDAESRAKAYLVLISPVPLGEIKRTEIETMIFDPCGYADVWLYPVGEQPFSIIRQW